MSYVTLSDFERYFENFGTWYYGSRVLITGSIIIATSTWQNDIDASYNKINNILDSYTRIPIVPVGTNPSNGSYHPFLIEWNACDTIYTKLKARHSREFNNELPQWMMDFATRGKAIFDDIVSGKITLDTDTTNTGIGYPQRVTGTLSKAGFYSNWDSGWYRGSDYKKIYHFKITDIAVGTKVGQAKFQLSLDDGYSFEDTKNDTGTDWIDIEFGLKIRWTFPVSVTETQLALNDEWKIECIPQDVRRSGFDTRFKQFARG